MSYVLLDNEYVSAEEQRDFPSRCIRTGKLVSGLIRAIDNRT